MLIAMPRKIASRLIVDALAPDDAAPMQRGRGRPVGDHEAKREEILKAATEVIADDGYAGASLRKVANKAGCTTGRVIYYFANKDAMIAAVAEHLFDEWDKMRAGAAEHEEGLSRFLAWASSNDSTEWIAGLELVIHARRVPAFAEVYRRRYDAYRKAVARALAKSQDQGTVRSDVSADILADQICAIGDGLMLSIPNDPRRFTAKRVRALVEATMALIRSPQSAASAAA
jgi:AcrR family transcriptional regulator